jgi:hypothetical protein
MPDLVIGGNPQGTRALLADSLAVWHVCGTVQAGEPSEVAVIHAEDGTVVRVERALDSERPVRWWVRWHEFNAAAHGADASRSRPCTSAVGLLRAVREALGAEGGRRLRIGPSASET